MGKTRHREYVDAIKSNNPNIKVDKDYQPFLINRALNREERNIFHLNAVNYRPVIGLLHDAKNQRLFHKQLHFDYLVNSIEGYN